MDDKTLTFIAGIVKFIAVVAGSVFGGLKAYKEYNRSREAVAREKSEGLEALNKTIKKVDENRELISAIQKEYRDGLIHVGDRIDDVLKLMVENFKNK
jgi:hypothetical protein